MRHRGELRERQEPSKKKTMNDHFKQANANTETKKEAGIGIAFQYVG